MLGGTNPLESHIPHLHATSSVVFFLFFFFFFCFSFFPFFPFSQIGTHGNRIVVEPELPMYDMSE